MRYKGKQINETRTEKERKVLLYQNVISKNVTVKKTHENSCEKKKKKDFISNKESKEKKTQRSYHKQ